MGVAATADEESNPASIAARTSAAIRGGFTCVNVEPILSEKTMQQVRFCGKKKIAAAVAIFVCGVCPLVSFRPAQPDVSGWKAWHLKQTAMRCAAHAREVVYFALLTNTRLYRPTPPCCSSSPRPSPAPCAITLLPRKRRISQCSAWKAQVTCLILLEHLIQMQMQTDSLHRLPFGGAALGLRPPFQVAIKGLRRKLLLTPLHCSKRFVVVVSLFAVATRKSTAGTKVRSPSRSGSSSGPSRNRRVSSSSGGSGNATSFGFFPPQRLSCAFEKRVCA